MSDGPREGLLLCASCFLTLTKSDLLNLTQTCCCSFLLSQLKKMRDCKCDLDKCIEITDLVHNGLSQMRIWVCRAGGFVLSELVEMFSTGKGDKTTQVGQKPHPPWAFMLLPEGKQISDAGWSWTSLNLNFEVKLISRETLKQENGKTLKLFFNSSRLVLSRNTQNLTVC